MSHRKQKIFPNNDALVTFFLSKKDFLQQIKFTLCKHPTKTMKFVELFCNLEYLCMKSCKISHMKGLLHLKDSRILKLPKNNIKRINRLYSNVLLEELDLSSNRIYQISGIFHLAKLRVLKLNHNKIDCIPRQMQRLGQLIQIHVNHNWIMNISRNVAKMQSLQYFSILKNRCPENIRCQVYQVIEKLRN